MRKIKSIEERINSKVLVKGPDDCWLWTGGCVPKGYGTIKKQVPEGWRTTYVHREILILTQGEPPTSTSQALHSCDTPACCNPKHLSWGTESQNRREARDRLNNQGNQKLTLDQVNAIRSDARSATELASVYSMHVTSIRRIKSGEGWK